LKITTCITLILIALSCTSARKLPDEPSKYLQEVLDLLEQRSVHKNGIDWQTFRHNVFEKANMAKTIEDTYPAVKYAVAELNDSHSYFKPVNEIQSDTENKPLPILTDAATPDDIGYIRLPFCIGTENDIHKYISSISTKIKQQSQLHVKGWIIDLRGNFGGNMWPMLLAIEPLTGDGTLGYFVDADDKYEAWKLTKGKAYINDELVLENTDFEPLDLGNEYVAVLTDNKTASSGEAVTVALKERNNTRSFGMPTYGVSTGCMAHELADGSVINLAESVFTDREKKKYGSRVMPDVGTGEEDALIKGIEWIYMMNEHQHVKE